MGPLHGNDYDEECKYSKEFDLDFDRREKNNFAMNGDKAPPQAQQPATAAVNSIHWDVEEGRFWVF